MPVQFAARSRSSGRLQGDPAITQRVDRGPQAPNETSLRFWRIGEAHHSGGWWGLGVAFARGRLERGRRDRVDSCGWTSPADEPESSDVHHPRGAAPSARVKWSRLKATSRAALRAVSQARVKEQRSGPRYTLQSAWAYLRGPDPATSCPRSGSCLCVRPRAAPTTPSVEKCQSWSMITLESEADDRNTSCASSLSRETFPRGLATTTPALEPGARPLEAAS